MSLGELGQVTQACQTLAEVDARYPGSDVAGDVAARERCSTAFDRAGGARRTGARGSGRGALPAFGVAVSGGGDSVALLLLARDWAARAGRAVEAVTVDHGLRPGSAGEAAEVAALCARIGVPHDVLAWRGWDGNGNLQDNARRARRSLIADWARSRDVGAVALGHTLDDQAETLVMRLARGSGVDGLAAMAAESRAEGIVWLRPMLGLRRADLRAWLMAEGVGWAEDPSNEDEGFARVRVRRALDVLGMSA